MPQCWGKKEKEKVEMRTIDILVKCFGAQKAMAPLVILS